MKKLPTLSFGLVLRIVGPYLGGGGLVVVVVGYLTILIGLLGSFVYIQPLMVFSLLNLYVLKINFKSFSLRHQLLVEVV